MKFPVDFVKIEKCLAVWRKASGLRKIAGPLTEGRPSVKFEGKGWKASRLSYHLNVAPLPRTPATLKEGIVCHTCDNPWCINPEHLYLGTASQNTKDIYDRNLNIRQRQSAAKIGNKIRVGKKASSETRAKMSAAKIGNQNKKGKKESEETRLKKSLSAKRRASDPEVRKALSERMKGNTPRRDAANRVKNAQ